MNAYQMALHKNNQRAAEIIERVVTLSLASERWPQ